MAGNAARISWQPDDGEHTEDDAYYHRQWQAYSVRRTAALFAVYTWPVVCVGLFLVSRLYLHLPFVALGLMGLWFGVALALVYWAGEFRCPRCRRRYGALGHRKGDTNLTRGIFDKVCANCKLRKFENG